MNQIFDFVGRLKPSRSVFNLSHSRKMTADMGVLYPVLVEEVVPGDLWKLSSRIVARAFPFNSPVMANMSIKTETFFVPYRILDENWVEFITKGIDGDVTVTLPLWSPTAAAPGAEFPQGVNIGSLWDYMGFPTGTHSIPASTQFTLPLRDDSCPIDYPRRAYNKIMNDFYLDETFDTPRLLTDEQLCRRRWKKDYYTSALKDQQRGTAPAIPITGILNAIWPNAVTTAGSATWGAESSVSLFSVQGDSNTPGNPGNANSKSFMDTNTVNTDVNITELEDNQVSLAGATTFTPTDLRYCFQVQKWQERNSRAGVRYTEFLMAHFGESVRDDRLQRPEFIGATSQPILVSEVLQTSETASTPQGTLAGHGISADEGFIGKYKVLEHGLIMTLMSIMPRAEYSQGINRQWLRRTTHEFYFPEFQGLSEQGIKNAELYIKNTSDDDEIFGFQGIYQEMRYKPNTIHGKLRTSLNYWHLGRVFPDTPVLGSEFLTCTPDKRIFSVPSEPGYVLEVANIIRAIRPLPIIAEPGLIDHF